MLSPQYCGSCILLYSVLWLFLFVAHIICRLIFSVG
nr:MAG TPA: hypothetical protein [Caudoviricetes sp.]